MNINITTTSNLTPSQASDIDLLLRTCRRHDKINGGISLDSSYNAPADIPCFFLCYSRHTLCCVLSLFIPDEYECEIYGYTLPQYRQKHLFSTLLKEALKLIRKTSIHNIHLIAEPGSSPAIKTAASMGFSLDYSEYMLSYDTFITPAPKHILSLSISGENDISTVQLKKDSTPIAGCHLYIKDAFASIFDFEVSESQRRKGYGKEALLLILEYLASRKVTAISLHVTGTNTAALSLYLKNGFTIKEQLDYYCIPLQ